MDRREFLESVGLASCGAALSGCRAYGDVVAVDDSADYATRQAEIDSVKGSDYAAYMRGETDWRGVPALVRLERAFDKIVQEVKATTPTDTPAVWLLYNMGIVVKTKESCFAIDLVHRRAAEIAPLLDFLLLTHNHGDHCFEDLYRAVNGAHKVVFSNFKDNYGAPDRKGGYTRAEKVFRIKDVEIRTALSDHNSYLIDFTTAFEIRIGDFIIYHSGDSQNVAKLNPMCSPDLWFVHPRCGLKVHDGYNKFAPKTTVIAHLNELGHDKWRWSWNVGLKDKAEIESLGGRCVVPVWGERIV